MSIFKKKVGLKTLVVTDIMNNIKRFKLVTTNKGVINFVKHLETMKLDLEPFDHIKEMAYTKKMEPIFSKTFRWCQKEFGKDCHQGKLR